MAAVTSVDIRISLFVRRPFSGLRLIPIQFETG